MSNVPNTPDNGQSPLDAIRTNLGRNVTEWEPEPGDAVVGYIHDIEYVESDSGTFPVVHVRDDHDAIVTVACGRVTLRKQLVRMKAQVGDAIGIKYDGKVASKKGGNDFHQYRVDVVRIGERKPDEAFRDPEDGDLGLVDGAADETPAQDDVWNNGESDGQTEAAF